LPARFQTAGPANENPSAKAKESAGHGDASLHRFLSRRHWRPLRHERQAAPQMPQAPARAPLGPRRETRACPEESARSASTPGLRPATQRAQRPRVRCRWRLSCFCGCRRRHPLIAGFLGPDPGYPRRLGPSACLTTRRPGWPLVCASHPPLSPCCSVGSLVPRPGGPAAFSCSHRQAKRSLPAAAPHHRHPKGRLLPPSAVMAAQATRR